MMDIKNEVKTVILTAGEETLGQANMLPSVIIPHLTSWAKWQKIKGDITIRAALGDLKDTEFRLIYFQDFENEGDEEQIAVDQIDFMKDRTQLHLTSPIKCLNIPLHLDNDMPNELDSFVHDNLEGAVLSEVGRNMVKKYWHTSVTKEDDLDARTREAVEYITNHIIERRNNLQLFDLYEQPLILDFAALHDNEKWYPKNTVTYQPVYIGSKKYQGLKLDPQAFDYFYVTNDKTVKGITL